MESEFSGQDLIGEFSGQQNAVHPPYIEYPYKDDEGTIWIDQVGIFDHYPSTCYVCGCITRRFDVILLTHFCNSVSCYYEYKAMMLAKGAEEGVKSNGRHKRAD